MTAADPTPPLAESLPRQGALLGVDYGTRRIGVAICNSDQTIASPFETWISRTPELDIRYFRKVIGDYRIRGIVIGLPLMPHTGEESRQSQVTRRYGEWLRGETGLPVLYWDERYSSAEAETILWSRGEHPSKNKARLDGLAAQIILQGYLDRKDAGSTPHPDASPV